MVFFVCEGCNESLKKNKVDAHAARCRNCWAVSCVDCSVVFEGNDYAAHTSCVSEAQKYEGGLYKAKQKKMTPQERWVEVVTTTKCPANDTNLQNVLDRVAGYDNVPRKKAKYVNFMKNSIGITDDATIQKVWNEFEQAYKQSEEAAKKAEEQAKSDAASANATENGNDKKRSQPEPSEEPVAEKKATKKAKSSDEAKPIKLSKLIKSVLKKAPSRQLDTTELTEELVRKVREGDLSAKKDEELKTEIKEVLAAASKKFVVVQVVRLL